MYFFTFKVERNKESCKEEGKNLFNSYTLTGTVKPQNKLSSWTKESTVGGSHWDTGNIFLKNRKKKKKFTLLLDTTSQPYFPLFYETSMNGISKSPLQLYLAFKNSK